MIIASRLPTLIHRHGSFIAFTQVPDASMMTSFSTAMSVDAATSSILLPFAKACGTLAPVAAVSVFLAPIPTLRRVTKDRSVSNLPLLPYSSMIASTSLWVTYGFLKRDPRIWSANLVGLVLGTLYMSLFVKQIPNPSTPLSYLPGSAKQHIQACLITAIAALALAHRSATRAIGLAGVALTMVMFGSPLAALRTVLATKSAQSLPLAFTVASVVNCFLWTVSGALDMKDWNVTLPNSLGLALGLVQLALHLAFRDSTPLSRVPAR